MEYLNENTNLLYTYDDSLSFSYLDLYFCSHYFSSTQLRVDYGIKITPVNTYNSIIFVLVFRKYLVVDHTVLSFRFLIILLHYFYRGALTINSASCRFPLHYDEMIGTI